MLSETWKKIFDRKMITIFILGFASGFPLALTGSTFKLWLAQEKIDIKTIGLISLVGIASSLKFLWAPLLDRYHLPFLGRRKTWLMITQALLAFGLFMMAQFSPGNQLSLLVACALLVAFLSATQDVTIDAYRGEILDTKQIGFGSSLNVYGYRVAMWIAGGVLVFFVADTSVDTIGKISWPQFYMICAAIFAGLTVFSFFLTEPQIESQPRTLWSAVVEPFTEFFKRDTAIYILIFVFTFKFGDQIAGSLLPVFYKDVGYVNAEIGAVTKTFGLFSTLAGLFIGGLALIKFEIRKCLWAFGILQALSTASFALITYTGPTIPALALVVFLEDFSSGMATSALLAFMSVISKGKYTATQFALLSSLTVLGRTLFSGSAGYIQNYLGWAGFFYTGALLAIPGLFMLWLLNKKTAIATT